MSTNASGDDDSDQFISQAGTCGGITYTSPDGPEEAQLGAWVLFSNPGVDGLMHRAITEVHDDHVHAGAYKVPYDALLDPYKAPK